MTKLQVRARAVDMLGRQQIAGIPNAIHEIFKNAFDAYAEDVEVDFFRKNMVVTIRDNGYGMTREEVESRWLTLGTDSRINSNRSEAGDWTGPKGLPRRTIMGEKGIGRLAIAVIAPITLLLTRAVREDGLKSLVVVLVHWGLFAQPGIDISDIDVPILEFSGGSLPDANDIGLLVTSVKENIKSIRKKLDPKEHERLLLELEAVFGLDPIALDKTLSSLGDSNLSLKDGGYGTHFVLLPVAPELEDDIDGGSDKEPSKLEKSLLGFSNSMSGIKPEIRTEFRDHRFETFDSLIGPAEFFSPDEFHAVDHYFEGEFGVNGQFVGTISIYGMPHHFVCNWMDGRGRLARCGPFSLKYGYVLGLNDETSLSPKNKAEMDIRLSRIGGVYIYRDGIRILPYGNSDYDFLDFEKRRSMSASDAFFSYRRGFGYVGISHQENEALSEKAGREGFRENQAYRDFRSILINFFRQTAIEFFRQSAPQGSAFWDRKNELRAQFKTLAHQQKRADGRRKEFSDQLRTFFSNNENNYFEVSASEIKNELENSIERLLSMSDEGEIVTGLRAFEIEIRNRYRGFCNGITVARPRGLALPKTIEKDWESYLNIASRLEEQLVAPLGASIDNALRDATSGRLAFAQRRESALKVLEKEQSSVVGSLNSLRREIFGAAEEMNQSLKNTLREEFVSFRNSIEAMIGDFLRDSARSPDEMDFLRITVEQKISQIKNYEISLHSSIYREMKELSDGLKIRETNEDRYGALEARNQILEEKIEFLSEFAQMGIALGILQHEFKRAARGFRVGMRDLKPWADGTPPLQVIYRQMRTHFEHLDGYLKVLDPIGRRLNREKKIISGEEILGILRKVFVQELESSEIVLNITDAFRTFGIECRNASLIGAFVNIFDNAVYWVRKTARSKMEITLDADSGGFTISNSGQGIEERLQERIFEFGETTKPGGQGIGLALSREVLRREGLDVTLLKPGLEVRPVFRVGPLEEG